MIPTKNLSGIALCLILFLTAFTITLTNATTENNYKNDNNFLTNIYEATLTENGYKTNIIINPHTTGIYAKENGYKLDLTINTQGIGGSHKENNYKLNLIPEKTFPDTPDVAITKIVTSKTVVGQGYSLRISITVSNQALNYETLFLIIQANTTTIKTQTVTLTSGNSTTITFTWNTTGFAKGNYTIKAYAWPVPGETDIIDNNFTDGVVTVTIAGDLDGNYAVQLVDLVMLAKAYGSKPGEPNWNPNADLDDNGIVGLTDLVALAKNYGKTDP